jgi:hypothetical protein
MSFAILHMQKLKQPALKGIQIHNQREKESQTNPDIDTLRSNLNYDLVNSEPIDYNKKIDLMIEEGVTTGKAIRKDAVKVASFLVTSDTEFFNNLSEVEEKRYFETAYEFFCEEYGEKNIAYAMVHKDEKTPHMHVGFVPITEDGRLAAKDFFGKKQQLIQLQDKFHKHMIEKGFDLERGVSSDKKHIETSRLKAETIKKELIELEEKLKENEEIRNKLKRINTVQTIPTKNPEYVAIHKNAFNDLTKLAQSGIEVQKIRDTFNQVKQEKYQLELENKYLKKDLNIERVSNKQLEQENSVLKEENDSLQQQVQKWKEFSEKSIGIIIKFVSEKLNQKKFADAISKMVKQIEEKIFGKEKQSSEKLQERSKNDDFEIER